MPELTRPFAIFGKSAETGDRFTLLWCDADFSDTAKRALESLRRVFQFRGGQNTERYDPSYAIWPTDDATGWIVSRLLDAGNDGLGRPHTLRIEAIYLRDADLSHAALFLMPENWPSSNTQLTEGSRIADPLKKDNAFTERICMYAANNKRPSVLRSFKGSCYYRGFQVVVDENGLPIKQMDFDDAAPVKSNPIDQHPTFLSPKGNRPRFKRMPLLLCSVLLIGAAVGYPTYKWHQSDKQAKDAWHENEELKTKVESFSRKIKNFESDIEQESLFVKVRKKYNISTPADLEARLQETEPVDTSSQKEALDEESPVKSPSKK